MSVTITVTDNATPRIQGLIDRLGDRTEAHRAMGEVAASVIQKHFGVLSAERDRHSRFYETAAKGTLLGNVDAVGADIEIHKLGIAQRYFGGPIDPKNRTYLTIPAAEESYGKTVETVSQTHPMGVRFGTGGIPRALVELTQTVSEKTGKPYKTPRPGGKVLFWLVKHVDQDADPTVLPEPSEIQEATLDVLGRYFSN